MAAVICGSEMLPLPLLLWAPAKHCVFQLGVSQRGAYRALGPHWRALGPLHLCVLTVDLIPFIAGCLQGGEGVKRGRKAGSLRLLGLCVTPCQRPQGMFCRRKVPKCTGGPLSLWAGVLFT